MIHEIIRVAENVANKYGLHFWIDYGFKDNKKYATVELYNNYDIHVKRIFNLETLIGYKMLNGTNEWLKDILEEMAKELNKEK